MDAQISLVLHAHMFMYNHSRLPRTPIQTINPDLIVPYYMFEVWYMIVTHHMHVKLHRAITNQMYMYAYCTHVHVA